MITELRVLLRWLAPLGCLLSVATAGAEVADPGAEELLALSLEELAAIELHGAPGAPRTTPPLATMVSVRGLDAAAARIPAPVLPAATGEARGRQR